MTTSNFRFYFCCFASKVAKYGALKMDRTNDRKKERHVTYILGLPVVETYIFECGMEPRGRTPNEANHQKRSNERLDDSDQSNGDIESDAHGIRLFLTNNNKSLGLLTIAILVLLVAYLTGSYIAVKNCPEQVQVDKIQNALYECENKLSDASTNLQQNAKLKKNLSDMTREKSEQTRKVRDLENELSSLKVELDLAKQQSNDLQGEKEVWLKEKDRLSKDVADTKYKLGACKNKNMDHEVRTLELIQENDGLKKELAAC